MDTLKKEFLQEIDIDRWIFLARFESSTVVKIGGLIRGFMFLN